MALAKTPTEGKNWLPLLLAVTVGLGGLVLWDRQSDDGGQTDRGGIAAPVLWCLRICVRVAASIRRGASPSGGVVYTSTSLRISTSFCCATPPPSASMAPPRVGTVHSDVS